MTETEQTKYCKGCSNDKSITDFYKVNADYYQVLCKKCHNRKRAEAYVPKTVEQRKMRGFGKLPPQLQTDIKNDISNGKTIRTIYETYKTTHPTLNYQTMLKWKRSGKIPLVEPVE